MNITHQSNLNKLLFCQLMQNTISVCHRETGITLAVYCSRAKFSYLTSIHQPRWGRPLGISQKCSPPGKL